MEPCGSLQGEIAELDQSPADDRAWQRGTARCGRMEGHGQSPGVAGGFPLPLQMLLEGPAFVRSQGGAQRPSLSGSGAVGSPGAEPVVGRETSSLVQKVG